MNTLVELETRLSFFLFVGLLIEGKVSKKYQEGHKDSRVLQMNKRLYLELLDYSEVVRVEQRFAFTDYDISRMIHLIKGK